MNSRIKELINPLPGYKLLHVSACHDSLIDILLEMMQGVDGRLNLAFYNQEGHSSPKQQYIKNYSGVFRALPRDHDTVILHQVFLAHENKEALLKAVYETLANAAYIIIIEPKGEMDLLHVKDLLIEHEFRAPNEIELLEGYDLVMAKKMHMWGNGL
jgi:vesicle coat complex subunit